MTDKGGTMAYGTWAADARLGSRPAEPRRLSPRPWPRRPPPLTTLGSPDWDDDLTLELEPAPALPVMPQAPAATRPPATVAAPTLAPATGAPPRLAPPLRAATPEVPPSTPAPARPTFAQDAAPPLSEPPVAEVPGKSASLHPALLLLAVAAIGLLALATLYRVEWRPSELPAAARAAAVRHLPAVAAAQPAPPPGASGTSRATREGAARVAPAPGAPPLQARSLPTPGAPAPAIAGGNADPAVAATESSLAPEGSNATEAPALSPSAARRECMAQVETARLFLQLAHESANFSYYAHATRPEIDRIVESRRVGPKTVAGIADAMWERKDAPERSSDWWSNQFTRCTEARMSGSWYVVR